jgi:hypothetical protein
MKKGLLIIVLLFVLAAPALADDTTFSHPAGGEVWLKGTMHTITYTFSQQMNSYDLVLLRNGVIVGTIAYHNYYYPAGVYNQQWQAGMIDEGDWAPCGSGYYIGVSTGGSPTPHGISNTFTIFCFDPAIFAKIKSLKLIPLPGPRGCPECFILDLKDLREELVKLDLRVGVGLFLKGRMVADLGKIGKGQGFAAKLQVKLEPRALAAAKRGEEFELQLLSGRNQLLQSHPVRLMLADR